jgi:hypothetical protein
MAVDLVTGMIRSDSRWHGVGQFNSGRSLLDSNFHLPEGIDL